MPFISYQIENNLGIITLNNPPLNLLSKAVTDELEVILSQVEKQLPRGLILKSDTKTFCAGADVSRFKGMTPKQIENELSGFMDLVQRIEALPIPTMAAVNGVSTGGGLELALAFDLIYAGESARFGQTETIIGAIPFGGGIQRLANRAGSARAKEIFYHGGMFSAEHFEKLNIINAVVADDELLAKAIKTMTRYASGPTKAYAYTKNILTCFEQEGMKKADKKTVDLGVKTFATEDFNQAVISLLKEGPGKATFKGK